MRRLIFISLFTGIIFNSIAQKNIEFLPENFPDKRNEFREAINNLKEGDYYFDSDYPEYFTALKFYKKADKFNPRNAKLKFKIGVCYIHTKPVSQAIRYLKLAHMLDSNVSQEYYYQLGLAYYKSYNFSRAIDMFNKQKSKLDPVAARNQNSFINKKISQCETAKKLYDNARNLEVKNLGKVINTEYPEYGPVINSDGSMLFFTSRRESSTGGRIDEGDMLPYEDIFISENKNSWQTPYNDLKKVNTRYHEAVVGVSPDGQILYLYSDKNRGDIYYSELKGTKWQKPQSIGGGVNSKAKESSASLSYDGRRLFFTSDRENGYGGMDVYYVERKINGEWGKAKNIGRPVNTDKDEIAVFMHPDGKTLYFSSNGHIGMGSYDVFKTILKNGKWSEPVNMGYPINTVEEDIFFSLSASGEKAYYSSVRPGGFGRQDIYVISFAKDKVVERDSNVIAKAKSKTEKENITEAKELKLETTYLTLLKGKILDEKTKKPVSAVIQLVDNTKNELIAEFRSNEATGLYLISLPSGKNYGITVNADNYLFHSENFNIPANKGFSNVNKDILLKRIEVGNEITLNNIFFEYKKSELTNESISELNRLIKLLNDHNSIRIEVNGHTDNVGGEDYNLELSKKRAKAVVDYLVRNGIDSSRLEYNGYGYSKPIESNETDEGRSKNRRVGFKIIGD